MRKHMTLAIALLFAGLACIFAGQPRAQMTLTGIGSGGSTGAAPSCTFPTLSAGVAVAGRWNAINATAAGGNVVSATDLSPNGNASAPSGIVPLNPAGYNGKPAFDFKAANAAYLFATNVPMGTGSGWAMFIGQMLTATTGFGGGLVYGVGAVNDFNGAGSAAFISRNNGTNGIDSRGGVYNPITASISLATNYRMVVTVDNAGGTGASIYVNNVLRNNSGVNTGFSTAGTVVAGGRYASGPSNSESWEGPVPEFGLGSGLPTTTDLNNIDAYATCQWGP